MDEFGSIINQLAIFKNLYDVVRIVDPFSKKVALYDSNEITISEQSCYAMWKKNKFCKNCISMRAYNEKMTFVKVEYIKDKLILLTAFPISTQNQTYIIEFMKDITETGMIEKIHHKSKREIDDIVAKMNELAIRDELTNIYNRRYINERLPISIVQSLTTKKPISIIMSDIDHFKKVNDTLGHVTGDYVLKEFAQLLQSTLRKDQDWVGRYGGEEFLIVLDNVDNNMAYTIAEKIRRKVEKNKFQHSGKLIPITASFGVCTLDESLSSMESFIECADKNLYKAKKSGRNSTVK